MRRLTDSTLLAAFMRRLGQEAQKDSRIYFTGGATAVQYGWRSSTIDIDIKMDRNAEALLKAIPRLKDELEINVELACPADFIPELPNWRARSPFIRREGKIDFFHYDLYSQALAKIERAHSLDLADVREMIVRRLIDPGVAADFFQEIEPMLYRFPAIDPRSFRQKVEEVLREC